jgi:hypothetical protein
VTILEVIRRSTDFLTERGVESPRLQVELLLSHVLKLPRLKLYLQFDPVLANTELTPLRELVKRRGQREPLQHLTGTTAFLGHELEVTRDVLVPRPETEVLAQLALAKLTAKPRARPPPLCGLWDSARFPALWRSRWLRAAGGGSARARQISRRPGHGTGNAARNQMEARVTFTKATGLRRWCIRLVVRSACSATLPYIPTAELCATTGPGSPCV